MSRIRLIGAIAVVAAALLLVTTPCRAYRVLLDHDVDGDLTTFENDVFEELQAPITIVLALDPEDTAGTWIHFTIAWDCTEVPLGLSISHGFILWEEQPDAFPLADIIMFSCTGLGCDCVATAYFEAQVTDTAPGVYAFAVVPFVRFEEYPVVTFEVACPECDYLPEDAGHTTMMFWEDVVSGPEDVILGSWGSVKARYDK